MKNTQKEYKTQWSFLGKIVLVPVPFLLWLIAYFVSDYFKESDVHFLAVIFKVSALIFLVFTLLTYFKGSPRNMPKFMVMSGLSKSAEDAVEVPTNAKECLIVDADSVLHPSVIEVLNFMATLVPDGAYAELDREHQVMTEVAVYLQYQRIDQAICILAELENKSASANELVARLVALKSIDGTDQKSLEFRKLKHENERQKNEIQFLRSHIVRN